MWSTVEQPGTLERRRPGDEGTLEDRVGEVGGGKKTENGETGLEGFGKDLGRRKGFYGGSDLTKTSSGGEEGVVGGTDLHKALQ